MNMSVNLFEITMAKMKNTKQLELTLKSSADVYNMNQK